MMKIAIPKNLRELKQNLNDPLYKNSIFLLLSFIIGAGSGFIFWVFAARFYSTEDVGLASAMISAMMMLSLSFSLMGFEFSLAHYLPTNRGNKREMINSCLTLVFLVSILFAFIFILGLDFWSPALAFIRENSILLISFVVFTASISLSYLQSFGIFVGFRRAKYSFIQNLVISLRFAILPLLVAFGVYGIFMSYGLVMIFGLIIG